MKSEEIRKMKLEELQIEDDKLRRELYKFRALQVTEPIENPMQIREIRRDIARINTELRRRQLEEAKA